MRAMWIDVYGRIDQVGCFVDVGGCFFEGVVGVAERKGFSVILAVSFRRADWYLSTREDIGAYFRYEGCVGC